VSRLWRPLGAKPFVVAPFLVAAGVWSVAFAGVWSSAPSEKAQVSGVDGTSEAPVDVGSVIAQGRREGNNCVFDHSFGVQIRVTDQDASPSVRWQLDEGCRAIVTEIVDPGPPSGGSGGPRQDGTSQELIEVSDLEES